MIELVPPKEGDINGVIVYQRKRKTDDRGFFERLYCRETLSEFGLNENITQANRSVTNALGSVRGLHFQHPPHAESKMISCLRGEVYDVAVDLRRNSPTFLKHMAILLSGDNNSTVVIPKGVAHGFQTLTDQCEMLYFHTHNYTPSSESGINPFDPTLAIKWPVAATVVSSKDANLPNIDLDFLGLEL